MKRITLAAVLVLSVATTQAAQRFSHTKFAEIVYGSTTQTLQMAQWFGGHVDLLINPSSFIATNAVAANPNLKYLNYMTFSTVRDQDTIYMDVWDSPRGINKDTLIIRVASGPVQVSPPQNIGAPCPSMICQSTSTGARLYFCQWNTTRNIGDLSKPGYWQWIIYKACVLYGSGAGYWGPMEDEAICDYQQGNLGAVWTNRLSAPQVPWAHWPLEDSWCLGSWASCTDWSSYVTHNQVRQRMLDLHDQYMPIIMDSLNARGLKWFANGAAYGRDSAQVIHDAKNYGRSLLYGEGMNVNIIGNGFKQTTWNTMDSIGSWGPLKGCYAAVASYIGDNASMAQTPGANNAEKLQRQNFHNYCFYMMATNPYTFLYVHGNNSQLVPPMLANDFLIADTLYKWQNVQAVDVGPPVGARSIVVAGTYPVYRRDFQKGVILYRPGASGADMTDASAVSVNLGRTMYRVNIVDTSKQAASTSTMLRVGDGAVLVDSTYFIASQDIDISGNPTVFEGNQLGFNVTRTWANTAVSIYYTTLDGLAPNGAQAPGDYVAQTNGRLDLPIGSASGTIFVQTNTDALSEQTETVRVQLQSSTSGTIRTASATGNILDGTPPPSTSTGKKFKVKKG